MTILWNNRAIGVHHVFSVCHLLQDMYLIGLA